MAFQGRRQVFRFLLGGLLVTGSFPLAMVMVGGFGTAHAAQVSWSTSAASSKKPLFRPVARADRQMAGQRGKWRPRTVRSVRPGQDAFAQERTRPWSWQPALNAPPAYGVGVSNIEAARRQGLKFRPYAVGRTAARQEPTRSVNVTETAVPQTHTAAGFRPAKARPRYERLYSQQSQSWSSSSYRSAYPYGITPYHYSSYRLQR